MSVKKKIITLAISVVALGAMATAVYGESLVISIQAYINSGIKIVNNGSPVVLRDEYGNEQPVVIFNGRSYLPLRAVAGLTGMDIKWDDANMTVMLNNKPSISSDSNVDARNATYVIGNQSYTLTNGKYEKEIAPDSATKIQVTVWSSKKGDLNGDGKEDEAVILSYNGGGSGTFYYIAAVLNNADGQKASNAILLGDRLALQNIIVDKGTILINYADRKPGEPMTAQPSVGVSKYFRIENGNLNEV